jgi:PAS domain S-box-containing protein
MDNEPLRTDDANHAAPDLEAWPLGEVFRQSHTPTVLTNPRLADNPIVLANDAFLRLTGYGRDEVLGRNCRFLGGAETDPRVSGMIRVAIQETRSVSATLLNHRRDGSRFWSELQISPIFDADGTLAFFVGYQNDITWRVEADQALRRAHRELGERLAEREDLVREIQHRVRNNLQTIIGLLNLERRRGDPAVRRRLDVIAQRVGVLGDIHKQLETFANWNAIDFGRHLRETSAALTYLFEDGVTIEVDADPFTCDVQVAISLGLIANELIAVQLALVVSSGEAGRAGIAVRLRHRKEAGILELTVRIVGVEQTPWSGGDIIPPSDIVDVLVEQIGAELVLDGSGNPSVILVVGVLQGYAGSRKG